VVDITKIKGLKSSNTPRMTCTSRQKGLFANLWRGGKQTGGKEKRKG